MTERQNISISIVPDYCSHHAEGRFQPVGPIENKIKFAIWGAYLCLGNTEVCVLDKEDDVLESERGHCLVSSVVRSKEINCEMGSSTEMD